MESFDFQERAVSDLCKNIKFVLDNLKEPRPRPLLVAPVGAGKTYMCSQVMERLWEERDELSESEITFMWLSKSDGDLCEQSRQSIKKYIGDIIDTKTLDDLVKEGVKSGKCYFIPYQKCVSKGKNGEFTNIVRREGEKKTLDNRLDENRARGKSSVKIILFADEAHKNVGAEKSSELIELISPACLVGLTATPNKTEFPDRYFWTEVAEDDARKEFAIRQGFNIQNIKNNQDLSLEHLIKETVALQARKKKAWEADETLKEKGLTLPRVLIQIASNTKKSNDSEVTLADEVVAHLKDAGVEKDNIYVWLSNDKKDGNENSVEVKDFGKPKNTTEYLIFKQAVAEGWDCPCASTLLRLRHGGSVTFNLQTVGRIGRNPVPSHYFDNELIDWADIITNDPDFIVASDALGEFRGAKTGTNKVKEKFAKYVSGGDTPITFTKEAVIPEKPDKIDSMVGDKVREILDDYFDVWSKSAAQKIQSADFSSVEISYITHGKALQSDLGYVEDAEGENTLSKRLRATRAYDRDTDEADMVYWEKMSFSSRQRNILEAKFEEFIQTLPKETKDTNYTTFYETLLLNFDAQKQMFADASAQAKYIEKKVETSTYTIPSMSIWKGNHESLREVSDNYLYDKAPDGLWSSKPERGFVENVLKDNPDILFWFKNQDRGSCAFSISYKEDEGKGELREFYPDFGVALKGGAFVWLEIKGGVFDIDQNTKDKLTGATRYLGRIESGNKRYAPKNVSVDEFAVDGIRIVNPETNSDYKSYVYFTKDGNYTNENLNDRTYFKSVKELFSRLAKSED